MQQLIPYRIKDKWGFCDEDKKIVLECIYNVNAYLPVFTEGLTAVKVEWKIWIH